MTGHAKEILFVSIDGMTDPLGQSQVIPYLAGLRKAGYGISLLSCEKAAKAADRPRIRQLLGEQGIRWYPIDYKTSLPFVSQIQNYRRLLQHARRISKRNKVQMIHARSYLPALAALRLKQQENIPFLFDMRGFWANERVDGGIWKLSNPLHRMAFRFFKKKEKEFITASSHIISLTHNAKREILSWGLPVAESKITVIPCCADFSLFNYATIDAAAIAGRREALAIPSQSTVVSYSGSLGTWYMLPEMLGFFKCLLEADKEAVFLVITTDDPQRVFEAAKALDVPFASIRVTASDRRSMPHYLALSRFSLFFIRPSYSKKASSPTKLAEILGCGIPVVTNTGVGDVDTVIAGNNCGLLIAELNEAAYRNTIAELPHINRDRQNLFETAKQNFDLASAINAYISVYKSSLNEQ